ncbi:hypothetical protein EYF80_046310 [Liparis tanakae]|uniref:Uncharacterized protein n=1 Tax=Liparis tanakae TaxID=230148 RepID=A0A4Z2FQS1_9TELE|nr:hypothetical protein EYF80_046310 [Liparis tanakae]
MSGSKTPNYEFNNHSGELRPFKRPEKLFKATPVFRRIDADGAPHLRKTMAAPPDVTTHSVLLKASL